MSEIFNFWTRAVIVLDSFNSGKLAFVDPIHEFLWILFFIGNFLNLKVKEETFSGLDYFLKLLPILNTLGRPILLNIPATICIPPTLWVVGDIDDFWIFSYIISKDQVKEQTTLSREITLDKLLINIFDKFDNFINKGFPFLAIFDYYMLFG